MFSGLPVARAILLAALVASAPAACGRRGPLEPPPVPGVNAAGGQEQAATAPTFGAPVGTPRNRAREPIVVPQDPFILDPLL